MLSEHGIQGSRDPGNGAPGSRDHSAPRSLTICHVITRLILGGAQQSTVMSAAAQVQAGHHVTLAYGPIYGPEGSLLDEARDSGVELIELSSLRRAILPWHDVRAYIALRRLFRRLRPDVVHTHSSKAGILGRIAAWHENVPAVIHTVHGLPFHDQQPRWLHDAYVALERQAARRCHRLIAITPQMVDAFEQASIASRDKFTVIPSGIDLAKVQPADEARKTIRAEFGIPDDAPVVGIVARLDPLKGHHDLLAIYDQLAERFPDLRMLFVGDGWDRQTIEQDAHVQQGRVILTGLVPHARIADMLSAMDVKVLPSYQEGQSRTLAEALLAGCGIVAYDVGGIGSICIDGETGRLVPVGDRAALADAVAWMLDHPDQRHQLTERGRAHVQNTYDARKMTEQIEHVYRDALQ